MKSIYILFPAFVLFLLMSCNEDPVDPLQQAEIDRTEIENYVANNNLNGQFTASGLYYEIVKEGAIASPDISSTVTVNYSGTLLNGTIFDANDNIEFPLANVILGWQEGIQLLKKGGSGVFVIPSGLAYGTRGQGSIPANSVLVFEVDLLDFE